eukprot:Skav218459  [mRNA]  locus=scaffold538:522579:523076:- [translate_table: standard]
MTGYSYLLVYTISSLAEASTPRAIAFTVSLFLLPEDEYIEVEVTGFDDLDLDQGQLGLSEQLQHMALAMGGTPDDPSCDH